MQALETQALVWQSWSDLWAECRCGRGRRAWALWGQEEAMGR